MYNLLWISAAEAGVHTIIIAIVKNATIMITKNHPTSNVLYGFVSNEGESFQRFLHQLIIINMKKASSHTAKNTCI